MQVFFEAYRTILRVLHLCSVYVPFHTSKLIDCVSATSNRRIYTVISMALQVYEYNVEMTCEGCSNAVTNVLNKKEGVTGVQIDLEGKKVFVTTTLPSEEVLQVIKKTGKPCQFVGVKK